MRDLIYETIFLLKTKEPEAHAKIRQHLYNELDLPFDKQLDLYTSVLGLASSGKLETSHSTEKAVNHAIEIINLSEK